MPEWAQKLSFESTGPGLVYHTRTAPFTEGAILTGGTSGATATISASFNDGTDGTLYLANVVGTFTDSEAIADSSGGAATITRLTYTRTNAIQRLYGVGGQEVRTDNTATIFTFWGAIDNFCPMRLFTMPASLAGTARDVELITAFAQEGFIYERLGTPNAIRVYLNGAWRTLGGSSGVTTKATAHTQNLTTTSTITYAHGFGAVPSTIRIQANVGKEYSDITYDGTNQFGMAWGDNQDQTVGGYSIFLTTSSGNIATGNITGVDATNVTISWADKIGSPTGTADFIIIAS